jgi:hypothetical protein
MSRKLKGNKLLMYLVQNRADDFIKEFEKEASCKTLPRRYPIESLYLYVYAAKILLDDNDWLKEERWKTILVARANNLRMWEYLLNMGMVPDGYNERLIKAGLQYAWAESCETYIDTLDCELDDLLKWGARKIDCDLFVAVQKLDFREVETLLKQGANPDAEIYVEDPASNEYPDTLSPFGHAAMLWCDAYNCQFLDVCWEHGIEKIEDEVNDADFIQLIMSSTHKLMYELMAKYSNDQGLCEQRFADCL